MTFAIETVAWLAAGAVLGAAYLFLIGRSVAAIGGQGRTLDAVWPLLLRAALAVVALLLAANRGALPLLMLLAGFLIARSIALHRIKES